MDVQAGLTDLAEGLVNTMPAETRCLDLPGSAYLGQACLMGILPLALKQTQESPSATKETNMAKTPRCGAQVLS